MKCFIIVTLFTIAATRAVPIKLPYYIEPCRAKDSSCLKNVLKELGPCFVQGMPELMHLQIDPFIIPHFNQSDPHSPRPSFYASILSMKYEGLNNFNVLKFDIDLDRSKFDLELMFPQVVITTKRVISGVGFEISVNGSGITRETLSNLTITFWLCAEEYSVKEKVYLKWRKDAIAVAFDEVVFEVDASFIDGKNYEKLINIEKREFPQVLNGELKTSIQKTFGRFVLRQINLIHKTYPVDVLYIK